MGALEGPHRWACCKQATGIKSYAFPGLQPLGPLVPSTSLLYTENPSRRNRTKPHTAGTACTGKGPEPTGGCEACRP